MENFSEFEKKHGKPFDCQKAETAIISRFQQRVPKDLVALWKISGFCGYGDGFLWIANPAELEEPLKEWFPKSRDPKVGIVRTGLGDIIFWDKKGAHLLRVQTGIVHDVGDDISILFWFWLCDDGVLKKVLDQPLFKQAHKKLGQLRRDECYGYKLALALGGNEGVENLARVKLREQLSILASLDLG